MPASILDDVIFPDTLVAVAARGRKRWATAIATNQGGYETRNGLRTQPLREYEIGMVPRTVSAWMAVDTLHDVVEGSLYGFLLRDPTNNSCTTANGLLRPLPAALRGTLGTAGQPRHRAALGLQCLRAFGERAAVDAEFVAAAIGQRLTYKELIA